MQAEIYCFTVVKMIYVSVELRRIYKDSNFGLASVGTQCSF